MSSSLVRVPLTLVTAAAFHVSMSPPTAPSTPLTSHVGAGKRVNRRAICTTARAITTLVTKGVYWTSAVGDTFILLAPYLSPIATIAIPPISPSILLSRISHPTAWIPTPTTIQTAVLNLSHLLHFPCLPLLTIVGTTLTLSGALLRSSAFRALGQFYACTNTGPGPCKPARPSAPNRRGPHGHAHALITTGPYAYVRHPGYAGLVLCTVGLVTLHVEALNAYLGSSAVSSWGVVDEIVGMGVGGASVGMRTIALVCTALSTVGAITRIRDEERALKTRFKGEWEGWAARVPYKLVPGVY